MERNPTLYAKMFGIVSRDRWVSLSIFRRVDTWAGEVLFLKGESPGPIRSTQPTRNELLKLTPTEITEFSRVYAAADTLVRL